MRVDAKQGIFILTLISLHVSAWAIPFQNGDFENGASPWQSLTAAELKPAAARSGSVGWHMTAAKSIRQEWIDVVPGRTYALTGWFKWNAMSDSDWGYARFEVADHGQIAFLDEKYEQNQWTKLAITFQAETTGVQINIGVFGPEPTVDMMFDDIRFFEKTSNAAPTLSINGSPLSGAAPLTVQFSAAADDADGAVAQYIWDFGDGSQSGLTAPSHTYLQRGTYIASLTVIDNDGAAATRSVTVQVTDAASPTLTITAPTNGGTYSTGQSAVTLSGAVQAAAGLNITGLAWDNVNTDEARVVSIAAANSVNWSAGPIPLKPGKNEILMTARDANGGIGTARLVVTRSASGPVIAQLRGPNGQASPPGSVPVYEKYEARFDVDTVADNPFFRYDAAPPPGVPAGAGVTVEGVITTPSGRTVRQPAFFTRDVTQSGQKYVETPVSYWAVRYSPQEPGAHTVRLSARDASGATEIAAGGFTATPPQKKGFIGVSAADKRYFSYSNGDLYFPVGPAWGLDYAAYNNTGMNFERVWMGGSGIYSTNWGRWNSSAEEHGNEGRMSPLNHREKYPGHDLSYYVTWRAGRRVFIGTWGDDASSGIMKANRDYLVKIRFKTQNMQGPANPSLPYGFFVKTDGLGLFPQGGETVDQAVERELPAFRNVPSLVPPVNKNLGWHTSVAVARVTQDQAYFSLYLDNLVSGEVYVDQFSVREILSDGSLGGEIIRNSKSDMHTYAEARPAAFIDWQLQTAGANGVAIKYVVQDKNDWVPNHLTVYGNWSDAGDGYYQPAGTKSAWLQEQWWRYLIARYGHSTALHSWELNNEGSPDSAGHYWKTQEFSRYMHQNDGHPHLANTSFWCCWRPDFWGNRSLYPDVDHADIHEYAEVLDMAGYIINLAATTFNPAVNQPIILAENGINGPSYDRLRSANPGVWYHNMLWAQLTAGSGVSAPNYWHPEHMTGFDKRVVAKPFADFINSLDIQQGGYVDAAPVSNNANIRPVGQKHLAKGKAHLWIQNKNRTWKNVMDNPGAVGSPSGNVTVRMSPNRSYTVRWVSTATGQETSVETRASDGAGDIVLPVSSLSTDVAVKIAPAPGSGDTAAPGAPRNLRKR